jgi:ribosomal protein L7/L12
VEEQQFSVSEEVLAAVDAGRKIEAIKILREETGLGLKEAKQVVDALTRERRADPVIAAGMVEEGGAGSVIKILVVIAIILGVYFYFFAA